VAIELQQAAVELQLGNLQRAIVRPPAQYRLIAKASIEAHALVEGTNAQ